jgi:hypothetical protein
MCFFIEIQKKELVFKPHVIRQAVLHSILDLQHVTLEGFMPAINIKFT